MKERNEWWIATTLLAALLIIKEVNIINGQNITSEDKLSTKKAEKKLSDLEGSETSYNFAYTFENAYNTFPYQTFSTFPTFSIFPYNRENLTNDIHQEIRCGDSFPRNCEKARYRTYDGSCNNLNNPTWGMANTRYGRLLPANYGDGIQSPTRSITGSQLPLARMVSYTLFPNVNIDDPIWTLVAMQWGQIITHDMGLIEGTTQSKPHKTKCCTDDGQLFKDPSLLHRTCYPMLIPFNDPIYSKSNIRCLNFVRSTTDLDHGCSDRFKPAEQLNVVTHFLDLSLVYGSSDQVAANLRAGVNGRLRVDVRTNREWLPSAPNASESCDIVKPVEVCYLAGDNRVNQNTQLTILQIILLREHNRIANALTKLNPHWTDETIFQETRRILIAEHQYISYYEWLPIFLGRRSTYGNKILYKTNNYVNDYNPNVNPSTLNEHSNAAFRYFHSLIAGFLDLVNENRFSDGAVRLSDYFNRPIIIEQNDNMDELTRGMSYQPQKASDQYFDPEITHFLFRNGRPLGTDLRATDIQRNRDHGLASYNNYREYCGLPRAESFQDFTDYISSSNVEKLAQLYVSPDDVEVTVGGSLEEHVPGTLTGPTFLCIFVEQFYRTRVGDRYWFERSDQELAFTIEQLNEIRKTSIARLFCDNGDNIQRMQQRGFEKVSQFNPIVSCDDIPSIDLSLWKDYAPTLTTQHIAFSNFKK
ncbi:peroxidase isoform X1 [Apis laboriosa]|uniref:peroxidase isoform X1 n=2 Tax=Apis laboriosa TaxID=183418 RepID=UPI001CC7300B|nr:peroxidase isoform X1 [Apis laboriosa]XP_043797589.1 peroxidase isoform X1 [Apis laboriosa]